MEEKKYYVYVYLDPRKKGEYVYGDYKFDYEPFYVGKGKDYRHKRHLNESQLSDNSHKSNLIKKLINNGQYPDILIIKEYLNQNEAFELEKKLIFEIGRYDLKTGPLTNKTEGGEGISGYKWTEEQKLGIKNRKPSGLGLTRSEEHKKKIGEANKGKTWFQNKERVDKFSELKKIQCKGLNNPFFGKTHSEETLKKISKPIIMFDENMVVINEFKSLTECAKETGFPIGKISSVANNKLKHYKKFKFKYK
jgi:group I intron endonuclease